LSRSALNATRVMKPHASLNESNLRERDIFVSSAFGFHFGRDCRIDERSAGVNWTVLEVAMARAVLVTSRRGNMSIDGSITQSHSDLFVHQRLAHRFESCRYVDQ